MTHLLDEVHGFFDRRKEGTLAPDASINVHHAAHAVEDLPLHAHAEGKQLLGTEFGARVQSREFDDLDHSELNKLQDELSHAYGELECVLKFLAKYPVKEYRYDVAPGFLTRGDRPDAAKLRYLSEQGFTATLSLCKETPEGDRTLIARSGLTDRLDPLHVGIVDGTPPSTDQIIDILELLAKREAEDNQRVYVHCEAGKGRTGVVVACYRMAAMGWSVEDALTEASNFGCSTPAQLEFIADFGARLRGFPGYPRIAVGDVEPTEAELTATLESCAAQPA